MIWYCHHQDAQVPKFAKGKVHVEDLQDTRFVDILFYQMQIMNTIRKHAHVISRYYNEFVVKNDKEAFRVNRDVRLPLLCICEMLLLLMWTCVRACVCIRMHLYIGLARCILTGI